MTDNNDHAPQFESPASYATPVRGQTDAGWYRRTTSTNTTTSFGSWIAFTPRSSADESRSSTPAAAAADD